MGTRVFGGRSPARFLCRRGAPSALAVLLAAALAACAPGLGDDAPGVQFAGIQFAAIQPVPPHAAHPSITEAAFTTTDAEMLPMRHWLPPGEPKAVILALHGFNDYSNAFDAPAKIWAARGIATYAYDQRGFGGAPGRTLWPGSAALATDAVTAASLLRRVYPGKPLYLLGESMGGAVAILAASGVTGVYKAPVDGVILAAPAVWTRDSMQFLPRLALWAGVRLFPGAVFTGESLHILASDNIPMLIALGRDPMVIKGARVDALYGLVDLMDRTIEAAPRLDAPVLLMYGAHDAVVPKQPVQEFAGKLPPDPQGDLQGGPNGRDRFAYYPNGYHMLLRDLDGKQVAGDVAAWVLQRRAPLPSHADATAAERPWPPGG
ncbi:MAG TPA: alpha/beta hydrolase [Stellaceae bacterium]|nr:alpha/beta hydrolase [Stellaceae bacterium]